jgi:hypothetical protein
MTKAEKEVAGLLKEIGIFWSYEKPIYIQDDRNRPRVWAPDFYLVSFGIYVEVCGSSTFDYDYRKKIFDKNGYGIIFLHIYEETKKWRNHLKLYLEKITAYRYHKLDEILRN